MKKFEYKHDAFVEQRAFENTLREYGHEGWELISVTYENTGKVTVISIVLKKEYEE